MSYLFPQDYISNTEKLFHAMTLGSDQMQTVFLAVITETLVP